MVSDCQEGIMSQSSPESETPDIIGVLRSVHSALDDALGDTDASHIENDDELRDEYPVQWAAFWLAHAIEALEEAKPPAGHAPRSWTPDRDAIYRAIENNVRSVPDENFIDRRWMVGINDAIDAILALADTSTAQKPEPLAPVQPHPYVPGASHFQGDCAVCGHVSDVPWHAISPPACEGKDHA